MISVSGTGEDEHFKLHFFVIFAADSELVRRATVSPTKENSLHVQGLFYVGAGGGAQAPKCWPAPLPNILVPTAKIRILKI